MRIGIGNDHTAVELKDIIAEHLKDLGFEVVDFGAKEGERCDYPVPGKAVAEAIVAGELDRGVLICGTGIGISLAIKYRESERQFAPSLIRRRWRHFIIMPKLLHSVPES